MGYQVIWKELAIRADVDVRRLFTDLQEQMHRNCDLFGLSLSWELDGPVLLNLLEKQNIPLWSHQRNDNHPLVFGGGPVLTANPEPLAPFLDVVLLGDGENLLSSFIDTLQEIKHLSRRDKLIQLAQIPGIYIPQLYIPEYSLNGNLERIDKVISEIPNVIEKQTWHSKTLSHSTVITPDAAWPNIHMVETVRSCPELCRFCLASYLTLPFRSSSLEDGLIPAIEKGLKITNRIGLLGASVTQHPQFSELLNWLNKDTFENMRLSISSVRASTVNPEMTRVLSKHNCKSITIAIESGSERMRNIVNKKLSEDQIFMAAHYAKEGGLSNLKLYGMVGLPEESIDDIETTAELLLKIKKKVHGLRLTLGVSTFVPKAHTPFQWYGVRPEADKRLKLLAKRLRPNGINLRPESYGLSLIQALISRSDRRLAPVILLMKDSKNSLGNWKKAYKSIQESNQGPKQVLPPWEEVVHENWENSKILPWKHLQGPVKPDILIKHQEQSLNSVS